MDHQSPRLRCRAARISALSLLVFFGGVFLAHRVAAQAVAPPLEELQRTIQELEIQIAVLQVRLQEAREAAQRAADGGREAPPEGTSTIAAPTRPLSLGARGNDVRELQKFLSQFPDLYPDRLVTGFYGVKTAAAVRRFQERHGLESVGAVGPKTLGKISELLEGGAGASGVVPPGLTTAPGIQAKGATTSAPLSTSTSTPVSVQTATTTSPQVSATTTSATAATSTASSGGTAVSGTNSLTTSPTGTQTTNTTTTATTTTTGTQTQTTGTATTTTTGTTTTSTATTTTTTGTSTGAPDLTILGFDSPTSAAAGQAVTLRVWVRNAGPGTAPASSLLVAFSRSSDFDASSQFYKDVITETRTTLSVPEIPPSTPDAERSHTNAVWVSWSTTIPQTTLSSLYFVAKADPDNQVAETAENDNAGGTQINVSAPQPPAAPTNLMLDKGGASFTGTPKVSFSARFSYTLAADTGSFRVYIKRPGSSSFTSYAYNAQVPLLDPSQWSDSPDAPYLRRTGTSSWYWWPVETFPPNTDPSRFGEYQVYVTAVNTAGTESSPSETKSVRIYAPPVVGSPAEGSTVSTRPTIAFTTGDASVESQSYAVYVLKSDNTVVWSNGFASTNFAYPGPELSQNDNPHRLLIHSYASGTNFPGWYSPFSQVSFSVSTATTTSLDLRRQNLAAISQVVGSLNVALEKLVKLLRQF